MNNKYILLLIVSLLWSFSFIFIEIALPEYSPTTIVFFRLLIGSFSLITLLGLKKLKVLPKKTYFLLFTAAFFAYSLPFFSISKGQETINSTTSSLIICLSPIFTFLIQKMKGFNILNFIGVVIAFFGVAFLYDPSKLAYNEGCLWVLTAAFSFSISTILVAKLLKHIEYVNRTFVMLLSGVLQLLPFYLWNEEFHFEKNSEGFNTIALFSLIGLGVFSTGITYLIYNKLITLSGAYFSSLNNYIIPIFVALINFVFYSKLMTGQMYVSFSCIIFGCLLSTMNISFIGLKGFVSTRLNSNKKIGDDF